MEYYSTLNGVRNWQNDVLWNAITSNYVNIISIWTEMKCVCAISHFLDFCDPQCCVNVRRRRAAATHPWPDLLRRIEWSRFPTLSTLCTIIKSLKLMVRGKLPQQFQFRIALCEFIKMVIRIFNSRIRASSQCRAITIGWMMSIKWWCRFDIAISASV